MTSEIIYQREDLTYLNAASIGLMPIATQQRLSGLSFGLAQRGESALDFDSLVETWDKIQKNIAQLIKGRAEGVTLTTNTASALHIAADGLFSHYGSGKNIVLTDVEFTTNSYIWQQIARRFNMEIRSVPYSQGNRGLDEWERLIDDNTVLATLSSIQFADGYRTDVRGIADIIHAHGGYLVVDGIQHIGGVPFDVHAYNVDFVAAGGYKWQLGPMGTGFFYGKPELLEDHESILTGWFSDAEFHSMTHHPFSPAIGARRYQQSFSPYYEAYNLSIEQILKWNPEVIHNHVIDLLDYLLDNLPPGYSLSGSRDGLRSNIIRIQCEDAENRVESLKKNGIIVAYREGGIRISPHYYNTRSDIDKLLLAL